MDFTDPAYLKYQYDDSEKLRIRQETHAKFGDPPGEAFLRWVVERLAPEAGNLVLDAGSGPGIYHRFLAQRGARVVGLDYSAGMIRDSLNNASAGGWGLMAARATIVSIPIATGSCDRVMANHVLYHVPGVHRALQELRRVLRPGGRAVMATNSRDAQQELESLHNDAARSLGYEPAGRATMRFAIEDLDLVRGTFPNSQAHLFESAFRFPASEPALRYYATSMIDNIRDAPADGSHRPPLLSAMRSAIEHIVQRDGEFVVQKLAGAFVAEK